VAENWCCDVHAATAAIRSRVPTHVAKHYCPFLLPHSQRAAGDTSPGSLIFSDKTPPPADFALEIPASGSVRIIFLSNAKTATPLNTEYGSGILRKLG
jgi:hypothetical protein